MKRARFTLAQQILLGLFLGIVTGIFFGEMVAWMRFVGDAFVSLLQITIIPYISLALITGLGSLNYSDVKGLALKGGGVLLLLWIIGILVVVLTPFAFPDWAAGSFFSTNLVETPEAPDFFQLFIPSNPFFAYANALVPAVVVFSILLGFALIGIPEKGAFITPLATAREALMTVTGFVSKLAPYGVFALIASVVGTFDLGDLARLQVHIVIFALTALLLGLWVFPALVTVFTPLRYLEILRLLRTPLITAFATGSVLIVIPLLIEQCQQLIKEATSFNKKKQETADSSVEVLTVTFFPFPGVGGLLSTMTFVLFAGWFLGSTISVSSYSLLIAAGIPSQFGGALLAIPFLLDLMQLPSDLFQVFVSVDVITSRFGTLLSVMHLATLALIGAYALSSRATVNWGKLASCTAISVVLLVAVIGGVRAFYTHVVVVPFTMADALRGFTFLYEPQPVETIDLASSQYDNTGAEPTGFQAIRERGLLRVCYHPNEFPSAFYNTATPPQLVGFHIEMAHLLARRQNLALAFLPTADEREAEDRLNTGTCDIYMRTRPISAGRVQVFGLTAPVFTSAFGLIVKDYRQDEFRTWEQLLRRGEALRIGVEDSQETLSLMRDVLPEATLIPLRDMTEQNEILEAGGEDLDAIVDLAEEGAAWALLYPSFGVVIPRPTLSIPLAYAVARDNRDLLEILNAWLVAEQAKGTIDRLYEHWMLGGALKKERPPRWSVIRDVLNWVN